MTGYDRHKTKEGKKTLQAERVAPYWFLTEGKQSQSPDVFEAETDFLSHHNVYFLFLA